VIDGIVRFSDGSVSMKLKTLYRLFFAIVGWSACFYSFSTDFKDPGDFFSYFTIQSNLLINIWFTLAVFAKEGSRLRDFIFQPFIRSGLLLYITVTMIVFFTLLVGSGVGLNFVSRYILHLTMPLSFIINWFMDRPKIKIKFKIALSWLIYPIVFCIYTLIRGPIVGWYPYYFLSPIKMGSYEGVEFMIAGLTLFIFLLSMLVYTLQNKLVKV